MLNIDKLISVCIVVLLVGLAGLVSIGVSNPSWSPFIEGPENINNVSVENAILGLINDLSSLRTKGAISALVGTPSDTLWGNSEQMSVSLDFDGEIYNPKKSEGADVDFDIDFSFTEYDEQLDAVVAIKFINYDTYLKVNASDGFMFDDYQEVIGDRWLKIGKEFFENPIS